VVCAYFVALVACAHKKTKTFPHVLRQEMEEARKKQVKTLELEREQQVKALEEERQEKIRALEKELKDIEEARLEQFEKERRGLEKQIKGLESDVETARKKSEEQDEAIEALLEEIKVLQQLHDETAVCTFLQWKYAWCEKLIFPVRDAGSSGGGQSSSPVRNRYSEGAGGRSVCSTVFASVFAHGY
jgi:hypothetical protein